MSTKVSRPPYPPKPDDVVAREVVWAALSEAWSRPEPALLIGLGRRRTGKSYVLARFAKAVGGIYYQATKRTESEQLAAISRIIGDHYVDAALQRGVGFPQWEDLFGYLTDRAAGQPFLLVLDEFPYLADAAPALPSIIQSVWDHRWRETRVRLVLNGSHIRAMQRLEAQDQPLYGRRTGRLRFPPLGAEHVRAFVPDYPARDALMAYCIFGGLPGHLALLRTEEDLAANVARLVLDPSGRLADEAEHLLDAFLADTDMHYSVLQAIAAGERTWSKITNRVGKPGGSLSRPLRWLEEMQLVSRVVPITEDPKTSRRALYAITDPYVSFWHRFVAPLVAAGETSITPPHLLWEGRVRPGLDDYMGRPFEDVCRSWVARATTLPFRPARVGSWWDSTSTHEIDIVALGPNRELLVGECKWGALDDHDLRTLRERAVLLQSELPAAARGGPVRIACFSARGEWGQEVAREIAEGTVLGFTAEDVLRG
jgi:uncharacterized protein